MISGLFRLMYLPHQPVRTFAPGVDQSPCACRDPNRTTGTAVSDDSRFALALLSIYRGCRRNGGIRCTVPAARPLAFERAAAVTRISSAPRFCILVGGGFFRCRVAGELRHVIVVGIWNVHDAGMDFGSPDRCRIRRFALRYRISWASPTAMACFARTAWPAP